MIWIMIVWSFLKLTDVLYLLSRWPPRGALLSRKTNPLSKTLPISKISAGKYALYIGWLLTTDSNISFLVSEIDISHPVEIADRLL